MATSEPRPSLAPLRRAAVARAVRTAISRSFLPLVMTTALLYPCAARAQTQPATSPAVRVTGVLGGAGPVALEGLPIIRVEVTGNKRTDSRVILNQVRAQAGQPYSLALVDVDVKAVAALDLFVTTWAEIIPVENEQNRTIRGVIVRFVVEERATVSEVQIVGNRKFYDHQIREGLLVRPGGSIDSFRIETDRRYILNLYHEKGYADAAVTVDPVLLKDKGIVRYEIVEGAPSVVKWIKFEGNDNLDASYIRWRIQTKPEWWIFRKGLLEDEKLQADVVAIREMYLKRGFLDARVSYSLDYSEDKRDLTLRFIIIEGPRYRIGKINVTGNSTFATFELLGDTAHFGPGAFAEKDKIDALKKRIENAYGHQGYINSTVEVATAYTDEPAVVDLNIKITENTPYIIGQIKITGNANMQDRVIRRQLRIYPDQTFDMVLVQKSIERLNATGLFNKVEITPVNAPGNPSGVQDALVQIQEGQTGKFSFGAGVSTSEGLVGQFSVEQKNFDITNPPRSLGELFSGQSFKGAGQYFRILLEPGTEFQRYRVTFEEPYLFDTPYSFSNDLYFFTRARESWDETRIGDVVTLGRRFGDIWSLSLGFRAEQVTIRNPQDVFNDRITQNITITDPSTGLATLFQDTAQEILNQEGSHLITSIKPAISRDTTDSRVFPTEGTRTTLTLEQYGVLGGDVTMTKIIFGFDWYKTLYTDLFDRKTVLSIRNQVGVIPFGDSVFYERFYLGGIGDLRGFRFRGVSPRAGPRKDPIGGDFDWVTTAEVNFPIYEDFLRMVVFTDVGTVERDITINTVRADFGAGMRLQLPFFKGVPLAVDFAYPVSKASGDQTQFVSISLGASF